MSNVMKNLHAIGLNPFAVQLLAESMLRSEHLAPLSVGNPQGFFFPVQREDCPGWAGVRISIEAVRQGCECRTGECENNADRECRMALEVRRAAVDAAKSVEVELGTPQQAKGMPARLQLGVAATKEGATVCLIQPHADGSATVIHSASHPLGDTKATVQLAAAPQPDRAPLSHAQIRAIHSSTWMRSTASLADFVRAIEAAHGIGPKRDSAS